MSTEVKPTPISELCENYHEGIIGFVKNIFNEAVYENENSNNKKIIIFFAKNDNVSIGKVSVCEPIPSIAIGHVENNESILSQKWFSQAESGSYLMIRGSVLTSPAHAGNRWTSDVWSFTKEEFEQVKDNFDKIDPESSNSDVEENNDEVDSKKSVKTEKIEVDEDFFYINSEQYSVFNLMTSVQSTNSSEKMKLLMVGPSGYGKTTIASKYAQHRNLKLVRIDCSLPEDPIEWFGSMQAKDGTTHFEESLFLKQLVEGNTLFILDEFNRNDPAVMNSLFPVLDDAKTIIVNNKEYQLGENLVFVATANIGYEFYGTTSIDQALLNRFLLIMQVGPLPFDKEVNVLQKVTGVELEEAQKIVRVAQKVRELNLVECSTRTTLQISKMISYSGINGRSAFQFTVVNKAFTMFDSDDSVRALIDAINVSYGEVYKTSKDTKFL